MQPDLKNGKSMYKVGITDLYWILLLTVMIVEKEKYLI